MNQTFTKSFCIVFLVVLFSALKTTAQISNPSPSDTTSDNSYNPNGRIWAYSFGDFYYDAHSPSLTTPVVNTQGEENVYYGVPTYRNAFLIRRVYLGYDYDISRRFSAQLLLATEPDADNTPSKGISITDNDNVADNKMSFYIRLANIKMKHIWDGADLLVGAVSTPGFSLVEEKIWGYRPIEKMSSDLHGTNSHDFGAEIQGAFDPATKNYGYNIMIGDNTGTKLLNASSPSTGFFKEFYGDLYAKLLDQHLVFTLYADYVQTSRPIAATTKTPYIGEQSHGLVKGFAAYTSPKFTIGGEVFSNLIENGVTAVDGTVQTPQSVRSVAMSIFVRGAIYKDKLGFFARYDNYNPDNSYNVADTYTVNTSFSDYDPNTKEQFATAGIDYSPAYGVHFIPNVWFDYLQDERNPTSATIYQGDNRIIIYRLTFDYYFGK